jgi:hypothetical protein
VLTRNIIYIGYVKAVNGDEPLSYKINGLRVYFIVLVSSLLLVNAGVVSGDIMYVNRWNFAISSCVLGLLGVAALAWRGNPYERLPESKSLLDHINRIYIGWEMNPQYWSGKVDAKMFLYLVGAAVLSLNILSFIYASSLVHSTGVTGSCILYGILFHYFIIEYLYHEHVHLYTFDFVVERVGFKLLWGCVCFYPFFYPIGAWTLTNVMIITRQHHHIVSYHISSTSTNHRPCLL